MFQEDTISAVATAIGEGGIGIVRMSGSRAISIVSQLFRGHKGKSALDISSHQAAYGYIINPATSTTVDEVLLLIMKGPHSYTREDVVEIHCHGGPVPLRTILDLTIQYGARLAEPGEFTKRAFLNGRLDLVQAEAIIDIIRAKTDASLRMAVGHLSGGLSEKVHDFRHTLLGLIAQLEATIDFPEEDIEELTAKAVQQDIEKVIGQVDEVLATANTGRILREGLETVIIGKPNVGKSSLLNALLKEKRAIVTDVPGTTRDIIEEYVNIAGIPLKIVDTAGLRDTTDVVEKIGVERAREFFKKADLVLFILDISKTISTEDKEILQLLTDRKAIILLNKTDLQAVIEYPDLEKLAPGKPVVKISALEGTGLSELEQQICSMVYSGQVLQGEGAFVNNVRQVNLLKSARRRLQDAIATIDAGMPPDCIVIDLREAWTRFGEITGDTVAEDIIDQIFTQFCIGK